MLVSGNEHDEETGEPVAKVKPPPLRQMVLDDDVFAEPAIVRRCLPARVRDGRVPDASSSSTYVRCAPVGSRNLPVRSRPMAVNHCLLDPPANDGTSLKMSSSGASTGAPR
jgi:hypothetical protein